MFNYKKFVFKKFAEDKPTQSQSGKILDELDTNKPVDKKVEEQVSARAQEKARSFNNAYRQWGLFKDTFEKLNSALQEVSKDSPFASVEPGNLVKACDSVAKTLNKENVITPDEIQDIYQQYIEAFQNMLSAQQLIFTEYDKVKNDDEVLKLLNLGGGFRSDSGAPASPQASPQTKVNEQDQQLEMKLFFDAELQKIQNDIKLNELKITKQQRQFMQFDILYQDMFNYYSLLSRICETKTRYDAQVEQFKFGSPEDYQALLSYYEYGMSLLQIMAPKAASIFPTNAKNIQSYYSMLIEQARAEISKLSIDPLKALYGRK
jgi:hypothetical protein